MNVLKNYKKSKSIINYKTKEALIMLSLYFLMMILFYFGDIMDKNMFYGSIKISPILYLIFYVVIANTDHSPRKPYTEEELDFEVLPF